MIHRRVTGTAAMIAALAMAATACTDSASGGASGSGGTDLSSDPGGGDVTLTAGLVAPAGCDDLLDDLKAEALDRVGPYGFADGGPVFADGSMRLERDAPVMPGAATEATDSTTDDGSFEAVSSEPAGDAAATDEGAAGTVIGTNNQEQGVDEADLVKTDGRRLVVVNGDRLQVYDVSGDEPVDLGPIDLPEGVNGGELFLDGDRALLMTSGWMGGPVAEIPSAGEDAVSVVADGSSAARLISIDLASGTVERIIQLEGDYLSARDIDSSLRIVLAGPSARFPFVYPSNPEAEDAAEEANRALIEQSTIDDWLPRYEVLDGDGSVIDAGTMVDCDRMFLPAEFAGFGTLVALTASIDDGFAVSDAVGVVTDARTIYASPDTLAVATPRWPEFDPATGELAAEDEGSTTAVHTFDLTDPNAMAYQASGSVNGQLLNQYSLSGHEGDLRVATTNGAPWSDSDSESFVTVLRPDGDRLRQIGQVGGLGHGETIQSVRFLGDMGYVVTFRQVDPLYTIDLSDPTDPVVQGELKIPGFSSYLHPVGDALLLGVGTDGDEDGNTFGVAVSLFDVSDPTDPTRVAKISLPDDQHESGYTTTPVSWDARAFTWIPAADPATGALGTAVVPVEGWRYDDAGVEQRVATATLLTVGADGSLTERGQVEHPSSEQCDSIDGPIPVEPLDEPTDDSTPGTRPVSPPEEPEQYCWRNEPTIGRSVVVDDTLYTVSDIGVKASELDDLTELAWFPYLG
ncbi:MAG: beta-propeller domain-containing protein [Acidimicrobiales bacterium]